MHKRIQVKVIELIIINIIKSGNGKVGKNKKTIEMSVSG